ncbi:1,2-dihydroxy-3-keto-5-methylthiopentene dioxygenase [Microbotryomycetes sp. JL201]|nr:1,2-dihydroxy-3-keto-5-methylthiopentene dioxygenase [Microbotryomycetes sp. JL201]
MLPWNPPSSFSSNMGSAAAPSTDSSSSSHSFNVQPQQQAPVGQQAWRPSFGQDRSGPLHQQQQQQQQQQGGGPQQQSGNQNTAGFGGAPGGQQPAGNPFQQQQQQQQPPMTLASVLHFLQTEHRRYAKDRNEWEIERAEMRARIALLEGEKRGNEGALRDLARRCKMLENALRGERSKFLSTKDALSSGATHSPSPSGTSSPVPLGPAAVAAASGVAPAKAAHILSTLQATKDGKDGTAVPPTTSAPAESASMAASTSTSGTQRHPAAKPTANGPAVNGTWASMAPSGGLLSGARDPRGKARSRDYLKQCLQEITYLTSATTLNPLSASSQAAPTVQRPRKVLPDHVPSTGPGVINLPSRSASTAESASSSVSTDSSSSAGPPKPTAATAVPIPTSASQSTSTLASAQSITKYPSDPASAYVPLKRTISQPGLPGSAGFASRGGMSTSTAMGARTFREENVPELKEPEPGSLATLAKESLDEAAPSVVEQNESVGRQDAVELPTADGDPFVSAVKQEDQAAADDETESSTTVEPDIVDIGEPSIESSSGSVSVSEIGTRQAPAGVDKELEAKAQELKETGTREPKNDNPENDENIETLQPEDSVEEDEAVLDIENVANSGEPLAPETAPRADELATTETGTESESTLPAPFRTEAE